MGKNNVIINRWLSDKARFADLMNGCLFRGHPVVIPAQLERIDRESDLLIPDKDDPKRPGSETLGIQRYRDVVMRWKNHAQLAILAVENQERIHYAMPVRTMIYDGLSYAEQIEHTWKSQEKAGVTPDEFLSHFRKSDRLSPVITLIFYYGSDPWDGSHDLHGMIFGSDSETLQDGLRELVPNYRVNLVDAERISDPNLFQIDLQYVLNMIKYRGQKEEILNYVDSNRTYFQNMGTDSYRALSVFLNSEKWMENVRFPDEEGDTNMCKALEEIYEDGKAEGLKEGLEAGKAEGLKGQITKKLQKNKDIRTIADEVEESVETVTRLIQEMAAGN